MSVAPSIEPLQAAPAAQTTGLLFERHSTRLYAFCLRRLRTREEAEDAVQQTFMKALAAVRGGFVPAAEKAWLYRIAENVCTDRLRSATYRRRHESSPEALAGVAAPSSRLEQLDGIGDALAALSEQQRRAVVLREWHGLTYREIARELELSQSAVETLLFRARRALARKLEAVSFVAWLKGFLGTSAGAKATAAAVAMIGIGVLAVPPAVDRLRERPEQTRPTRAPAVTDPAEAPAVARSPLARASDTESQASTRPRLTAEEPRPELAPPAAANSPEAGASNSEIQSPVPAPAVEAVTPAVSTTLPLPEPPVLPVPLPPVLAVPEVTLPAPEDVLEPVGEVVPELPALPTLP